MSNHPLTYFVYFLRSDSDGSRFYVGSTRDVENRVKSHNQGGTKHTAKFGPWSLIWFSAFPTREAAEKFEAYLKTGSGRVFQKRHLSPT
ncbi:MAG: GIY-YIG nuclease family protein [Opitutaceae bacterium]|nr:GIY-YIG nuclease family protein [Opitutaceae bacterium]